jgi:hypothetical protein
MTTKLKPCRFCKNQPEFIGGEIIDYTIYCNNGCGVTVNGVEDQEVVRMWNVLNDTSAEKEAKKYKEALRELVDWMKEHHIQDTFLGSKKSEQKLEDTITKAKEALGDE